MQEADGEITSNGKKLMCGYQRWKEADSEITSTGR
jgi:hypothetical protein